MTIFTEWHIIKLKWGNVDKGVDNHHFLGIKDLYVGYTSDLERRIKEHKQKFPNDKFIYYEAYLYEKDARDRERKLKYYGSAWRALKKRINA